MASSPTTIVLVLAGVGVNLLALGAVVMGVSSRVRARHLQPVLEAKELSGEWCRRSSLLHPWHEVGVGLCITLAIPLFTHFCLAGSASRAVAVLTGYVSAALCALGCFSRQRHDWEELGASGACPALLPCLGFFAAGLALFLWGVFTLALGGCLLFLPR